MVFALTGPLAHLDRLQIREVGVMRVTGWGASIDVQPAKPGEVPKCQPKSQRSVPDDQRGGLWASFYAGTAVDTFAPQIVGGYDYDYANPGAGGTAAMERVSYEWSQGVHENPAWEAPLFDFLLDRELVGKPE
jgi:hypothetical protein